MMELGVIEGGTGACYGVMGSSVMELGVIWEGTEGIWGH